jgi:hypothetical protein
MAGITALLATVRRTFAGLLRTGPGLGAVHPEEGWFDDIEPDDLAG